MPKLSDAEKERRAAERAEQRRLEAAEARREVVDAKFEAIYAQLAEKRGARERNLDVYRLFEAMHRQDIEGRLAPDLLRIHLRQEGLR